MRPAAVLLIVGLALAPAVAGAAVRTHMAHKRHHHGRDAPADAAPAPVSDTPDAVWASSRTRR